MDKSNSSYVEFSSHLVANNPDPHFISAIMIRGLIQEDVSYKKMWCRLEVSMIHNHIPFCLEVKGVPRFEWLKSEKGNPKEFPKITRIPQ